MIRTPADFRYRARFDRPISRSRAAGALALDFRQVPFADADRFGGDLHQFVVGDEFHSAFQGDLDRWHQAHGFVGARRADIGELFTELFLDEGLAVVLRSRPRHHHLHQLGLAPRASLFPNCPKLATDRMDADSKRLRNWR